MKRAITISILFMSLFSTNLFAKGWYKTCKGVATEMQDSKRFYVGGAGNLNHLHVGSDFIHVRVNGRGPKPMTKGSVNCASLNDAISGIDDGGYASPDDVTTCLNAVKDDEC